MTTRSVPAALNTSAAALIMVCVFGSFMLGDERALKLSVSDDGHGFDYDEHASDANGHYGLTMMRERAEQLHCDFTIVSGIGRGTRVEVAMPIRADTEAPADV